MARPTSASIDQLTPRRRRRRGFRFEAIPDKLAEVPQVLNGMVTALPRDKRPIGAGKLVQNARIRDYWCGRRPGTEVFINRADIDEVRKIVTYFSDSGDIFVLRIGTDTVYVAGNTDDWTQYTDDIEQQDGRWTAAQLLGKLYLATPTQKIRSVDFTSLEVEEIEEAPRARHITSFAERIVGGNILAAAGGPSPASIAWSANADPTVWDALDENDNITGAGFEPLIGSGSDLGDHITGLIAVSSVLVILRERSIWHATRQSSSFAPFRFSQVISGIGCDMPYSAAKVENAVVFADWKTQGVYVYTPGSRPQRINQAVEDRIFDNVEDLGECEGSYDPFEKEYHLGIADEDGDLVETWVYSFEKQAWTVDTGPVVTTIGLVSLPGGGLTIDELIGTIDAQTETIDELGGVADIHPALLKGTRDGYVIKQTYDADTDHTGTQFEFQFRSLNLGSISRRRSLKGVLAEIEASVGGNVTIEVSSDESTWSGKTVSYGTGRSRKGLPRKQVSGPDIYFRFRVSSGDLKMISYWMKILEKFVQEQT